MLMNTVFVAVREDWAKRAWWMTLLFYFCVYMTVIYMPFDFFLKPLANDHEIWFGFALTGWWAKLTEPVHWAIYGYGSYGFWRMKRWMWPWASLYGGQVVLAMLVWNVINPAGRGWLAGAIAAGIFAVPTIALWRHRAAFST